MLAKKYRLTKRNDFLKIFRSGKRAFSGFLAIYYKPNGLDFCRFAVVVSNKVSKKASQRNLIKRRLREIVKKNLFKFSQNIDIIISATPLALGQKQQFLESELLTVFKKCRLI
ncbi:MAG: ribonuclease P protein component [Patescibacteria group bacterium]